MAKEVSKKITRFGYIIDKKILDEESLKEIREELIATPKVMKSFAMFAKNNSFPLYLESRSFISIPKYYGLKKFGKPDINRLESYSFPKYNMEYVGTLRPNQEIIVEKIIAGFDKDRGGLLIAGCGSGKTNMAIYIACHYGLKTLFLAHKTFLLNQAMERVLSVTNIKDLGLIRQKTIDIDHAFVFGTIQSISKIDYDNKIFKDFGMIIIDEVHHMAAKSFSNVFRKMSGKYMLGISAEYEKNNGLYYIINHYMGPILHLEEQKPNEHVIVKKYYYRTSNKKKTKTIINKYTREPARSTMISNLVEIESRNQFIINIIEQLFDKGKNILCLSGRIKQVKLLFKQLSKNKYTKEHVGKYIGKMSQVELKKSASKQIIIGSFAMAEEGLDIENLNAIILCTPKTAIKQSIGRILRKEVYEEHPIVIDIIDIGNTIFKNQAKSRDRYYDKQKYNTQSYYVSDFEMIGYINCDDENEIEKTISCLVKPKKEKREIKYHQNIDWDNFELSE